MESFKKFLQKVHILADDTEGEDKIKDPKAPSREEAKQVRVTKTKVVSLEELKKKAKEIKAGELEEMIEPGEEMKLTFERLFEIANIKEPKHGWTILKVFDFIETPEYKGFGEEDAKKALIGAISASKTKAEEVLRDAINRDLVIDNFEEILLSRIKQTEECLISENEEIDDNIKNLESKKIENLKRIEREKKYFEHWKKEKIELEMKMAKAASYLTLDDVVSVSSMPPNHKEENRD